MSNALLIAFIPAILANASKSAPLQPSVFLAKSSNLTFFSTGIFFVCTFNICNLAFSSGNGTSNFNSILPGLNNAGSIKSGLFVAATIVTFSNSSIPSISVNNWLIILSVLSVKDEPLTLLILSNSSKKIIVGATILAFLNNSLIFFSLSPTHLLINSGPFTEMKFAFASFAIALASNVFPVPGGPYNNIPFGGFIPAFSNNSGFFKGNSIVSCNAFFVSSKPPMSFQVTFGFVNTNSLIAVGSIIFNASMKCFCFTFIFSKTSVGTSFCFVISGMYSLNAFNAASFVNASKSAPVNPIVLLANSSKSTSLSNGIPLVCICNISLLPSSSGGIILISLSNLPGLLNASSISSGLFVAAITTTLPLPFNPSIKVNSCATILFSVWSFPSPLFGAILSISSINIMLGAFFSASSNISLKCFSLSP